MLTVSGLARRSGVTVHAVRYYTRSGQLRPLQDRGNGYHFYSSRDVRRLRFLNPWWRCGNAWNPRSGNGRKRLMALRTDTRCAT